MSSDGRLPAVEGFRGVVVSTVVAYHVLRMLLTLDGGSWGSEAQAYWWWAGTFRFAVDAFFVLAGVFVVASWRSCRRRAGSVARAAWDFASRRARRILPAFWLAAFAFGVPAFLEGRIDGTDLALLAAAQQYLRQDLPGEVALPMWSLTTEVQFYVVAPFVAFLFARRLGVALLAVTLVTSTLWVAWPGRGDLAASLLPGRLDQFVAGAVVGMLAARVKAGERPVAVRLATARGAGWILVAAMVALGTFHGATFQRGEDTWLEFARTPIAGIVIGGIVLRLLCGAPVRWLEHPWWRFLGLVSYGLYLWHYPILDHGLEWFGARQPDRSALTVVAAVVVLVAVSVVVAALSYSFVEHRFAVGRRRPVTWDTVAGPTGLAPAPAPAEAISGQPARTSA